MSTPFEYINVDAETGDVCVMALRGGVAEEVTAAEMLQDLKDRGYVFSPIELSSVSVGPSLEDVAPEMSENMDTAAGIEEFVRGFERAYPQERD